MRQTFTNLALLASACQNDATFVAEENASRPQAVELDFRAPKDSNGKNIVTGTDPFEITWPPFDGIDTVQIEFSNDSGSTWFETREVPNTGSYTFDLNNFPEGTTYRLRMTDDNKTLAETEDFTIDQGAPSMIGDQTLSPFSMSQKTLH